MGQMTERELNHLTDLTSKEGSRTVKGDEERRNRLTLSISHHFSLFSTTRDRYEIGDCSKKEREGVVCVHCVRQSGQLPLNISAFYSFVTERTR